MNGYHIYFCYWIAENEWTVFPGADVMMILNNSENHRIKGNGGEFYVWMESKDRIDHTYE